MTVTAKLQTLQKTPGAPHLRNSLSNNGIVLLFVAASIPCLMAGIWRTGSHWAGAEASPLQALITGLTLVGPRMFVLLLTGFVMSRLYSRFRTRTADLGWLAVSWLFVLLLPPAFDIIPAVLALVFGLLFALFAFGGQGMAPFHGVLGAAIFFSVAFGDPGLNLQVGPEAFSPSAWQLVVTGGYPGDVSLGPGGAWPGALGATVPWLSLLGGLFLVAVGVASWRFVLAGMLGVVLAAAALPVPEGADALLTTWYGHLVVGNFLFVLIFVGADPACQALTKAGRWLAGLSFGLLTVMLRLLDPGHPEATLMALLLVSLCTPLVDAMMVHVAIWRRRVRFDA